MWECSDEERLDVRQGSRGVGLMSSEKMMVQIFKLNILCYKYAIMWLLCLRGYDNCSMVRGVGVLLRRNDGSEAEIKGLRGDE